MHEGHRQRMFERLNADGNLQDHELLEILLYYAIPRKNTNPLAHDLLGAFGSLSGVLHAETEQLKTVKGVGSAVAEYLHAIGLLYDRLPQTDRNMPSAYSLDTFTEYLFACYEGLQEEVLELYFVDERSQIKYKRRFTSCSPDSVSLQLEEVGKLFATHRPKGIVIAHNHPKSGCTPSSSDDKFTAQIQLLCSVNGATVYDHIIVGRNGFYSYFLAGRMGEIRKVFNVDTVVKEKPVP
ncbi:MAG: RadC family protein [Candidatus Gallimonas sp.]